MLITFQFPVYDKRYLNPIDVRIFKPDWDSPLDTDHVRYVGSILTPNTDYKGPWDGERRYAKAKATFSFCGDGPNHFSPGFVNNSTILFRKVQSDGKCLIQFQVGFRDDVDDKKVDFKVFKERVLAFLSLNVKIRSGKKLSDYIPLIQCGKFLKEAYYIATIKDEKDTNNKVFQEEMEVGEPLLLVEFNSNNLLFPSDEFQQINNKTLTKAEILLYQGLLETRDNKKTQSVFTWFIGHMKPQAVNRKDFRNIDERLVNLRINLLRLHSETFVMKRTGDFINNPKERPKLKLEPVQEKLVLLLKKQFENISKVRRFNFPQSELLGLVYSSEPDQPYTAGLENLIFEGERSYNWLKNIDTNGFIKADLEQIKEYYRDIKKNIDVKSPEIYFSYAWNDDGQKNSGRELVVDQLYDALSKNNYKIRRDKIDSPFGSFISDFMDKIGESYLVVVFLSNKYLQSTYCMFELYEIFRNSKLDTDLFNKRIILIHADEVRFDQLNTFEDYWNQKKSDSNLTQTELDRVTNIEYHFKALFQILKDINAKTVDILKQNDFELIRQIVDERLGL